MLVSVFGAICMRRTDSVEGLLCRMDSAGAVGCGGGRGEPRWEYVPIACPERSSIAADVREQLDRPVCSYVARCEGVFAAQVG